LATDQPQADRKVLTQDALERLESCRAQKAIFDLDIREAYFFTAPHRSRSISSSTVPGKTRPTDAGELQISIAMEEAENFATTLITSFMPEGVEWVDLEPSAGVPEVLKDEVAGKIAAQKAATFKLIGESNFRAELATALNPDASVGMFALWIDQPQARLDIPLSVRAVPLRELEVDVGPDGSIDSRFVVRHTAYRHLRRLLGRAIALPRDIEVRVKREPKAKVDVRWGFWRLWDEADVAWQHVVMVGETLVHAERLSGRGSCPLIPVPFNRCSEFAFGDGPAIKALPELRILDDMAAGEIENVDGTLRPPMTFPDDSFAGIENGVENGAFYAIRPGTANDVKPMYEAGRLDAVYFEQAKREQRVKRLFYNDFPQQRGDTPPTATQWVDEMAMAQRRIGTPGEKFWSEGPAEIFLRFYWLAERRGTLKPIMDGEKLIAVVPNNPTRRAQNQQKVAMASRGAQLATAFFPEEFKAKVDGAKAIDNIFRLLDVADVFPVRDAAQVSQAVDLIKQLQGGAGGEAVPSTPPGAPPANGG
jgi:hypothetical protein